MNHWGKLSLSAHKKGGFHLVQHEAWTDFIKSRKNIVAVAELKTSTEARSLLKEDNGRSSVQGWIKWFGESLQMNHLNQNEPDSQR